MNKQFSSYEAVMADEDFLAWYLGFDAAKAKTWEDWLTAHPEFEPVVAEALRYLRFMQLQELSVPDHQTQAAHSRLMQTIDAAETPVLPMQPRRRTAWWMAAAAAVVLMAVVGYRMMMAGDTTFTIAAPYGQLVQRKLPDGSLVTLNANSKLTVSTDWQEGKTREVWLEGEGFFEVAKTATKAGFVVHAAGMDVVVTGTKFNVVNRGTERTVLLTEGSVTLKTDGGKEVKMVPGEFVKLEHKEPQKTTAPPHKVLAWKQAQLVFENTPMTEVAAVITRHYGIKVLLEAGAAEKPLTGILPNNSLDVLLEALQATGKFIITRNKNGIAVAAAPTL